MSDYGRETVVFFEIDQPLCVRAWGDGVGSPPLVAGGCTAVLGVDADRKCFNTRFTCPVPLSYSASTLTLRFSRPQEGLLQYGNVIPCMMGSPNTSPASINIAAMDKSASALGIRESVTLVMTDFQHSDLLVDPYRLQRKSGAAAFGSPPETYEPFTRGTFWGKWLRRNPYFSGYACRIREGFLGDALEDMRVRHYVIDRIDGPNDGLIQIVVKDLFCKIEALKAQAPLASQGELDADIDDSVLSLTLSPAGIGDEEYLASGYLAIGDEIVAYTRVGNACALSERGALGTEPKEHEEEDLVQQVLVYTTELPHDIIYDLLLNFSSIPASAIDKDEWDVLASSITDLYTGYVAKPTPVNDLIGEICEQAGITVWPDVSTGMIRLAALRPTSPSVTVDDSKWIVDGSLMLKRKSEKRVSEVWVYYGQKNPVAEQDDTRNYHSRAVEADTDAEAEDQYGTPIVLSVFSRWIPQFGRQLAQGVGQRRLATFRDAPTEATFTIHASKDGELELAQPFTLRTADVQDETGDVLDVTYMPIEIERGENEIGITAQQITFSAGGNDTGGNVRVLFIENDSFNLNLRTIHDSLFTEPVGGSPGETVTFNVIDDVVIGSTSAGSPAIRTGTWPSGVQLTLDNDGRIQGCGGAGGNGAGVFGGAANGATGGDALLIEAPITIDNTNGEIWGGGGGGGGGGAATDNSGGPLVTDAGGGGAGGAGSNGAAAGGSGGAGDSSFRDGASGTTGSTESGGSGGEGGPVGFGGAKGGTGGNGGAPGQNGAAGSPGSGGNVGNSAGGSAGAAGNYVSGNSFVTWTAIGDVRGGVT